MESTIYLSILGFAVIIIAAWAYTEQHRKNQLQLKLDENELKRAELIGRNNDLIKKNVQLGSDVEYLMKNVANLKTENTVLKEKLDACQRVRDGKGRYVKKT